VSGFLVLLQYDFGLLLRSWIVRFWFALTVVGGVIAVVVSTYYFDDTSFLMSWALVMYAALGGFVVLVISTSAISAELPFLGDAVVSRGIAPTSYVLAKLVARATWVLAMFLVVALPTAFLMQSQALNNDMDLLGILVGVGYWSFMLTVLVFLGITFSVMFSNTLVGVVVLGVLWYGALAALAFRYAGSLDQHGILGGLPLVLQGKSLTIEVSTISALGVVALLVLPAVAVRVFNNRDL
jgi:hypothetical protein